MITGEQIKQAREEKNLSQEELSELLGVSRQAVSKWENGLSVPQGENRRRLKEVLELENVEESRKRVSVEREDAEGEIVEGENGEADGRTEANEKAEGGLFRGKLRIIFGWAGWIAAVILLVVLTVVWAKREQSSFSDYGSQTDSDNLQQNYQNEKPQEEKSQEMAFVDIRFYDNEKKEVRMQDSQYNSAKIDSILVQWEGEGAKSIDMYFVREESDDREMLLTQAIPADCSAILLNGEKVDGYLQGQIFFELKFPDQVVNSERYNVFYDPTIRAYIHEFDGEHMVFDEVEWVVTPGERATELGLVDEGGGFQIYNEKELLEEIPLSADCSCKVLDWSDNYVEMDVTPEKLAEILRERDASNIPYILTILDGQITCIREQYLP